LQPTLTLTPALFPTPFEDGFVIILSQPAPAENILFTRRPGGTFFVSIRPQIPYDWENERRSFAGGEK
jgi:hypothetical protein